MQDVLLFLTMAAVFAFGWFLMGRLDRFLALNLDRQGLRPLPVESTLRLGFCNPAAADGITNVLAQYAKLCPDVSVRIFYGFTEELLAGLSAGKLDVIFLPEDTEIPALMHCRAKRVSLNCTPVMMKYGGLPIEPIADGQAVQKMVYPEKSAASFSSRFVKCLEAHFAVPASGK